MKEMIRYGFTLTLICTVASASLAVVNSITKPKIIAQAKSEEETSLKGVLPEANKFEPVRAGEDTVYYKAFKDNKFIAVAFKSSGKGYSSVIQTMVGMTKGGVITAIKVLSQNETPGLGARVSEPSFTHQFANTNLQGLNEIQAITGATISSKAVIDSVKKKAEEIKTLIEDER